VIATALIVKEVELDWALSVAELAVIVAVQSAVSAPSVGEVKVALVLEVAATVPQPVTGLILHWTALVPPFEVDAASVTWPPAGIVLEDVPFPLLLLRVMDGAGPPPPQLIKERRKANRKLWEIARRKAQRGITVSDPNLPTTRPSSGRSRSARNPRRKPLGDRTTKLAHANLVLIGAS
jgi:hypothetical protein